MKKKSKQLINKAFAKKQSEPKENWLPDNKPETVRKLKKGEEPGSELNKDV